MSGKGPEVCVIDSGLDDHIVDVKCNLHGNLLAACSSSGSLSIMERDTEEDSWHVTWTRSDAHRAAILEVEWALPELGQVIATRSEDRSIRLWEKDKEGLAFNKEYSVDWVERQVLTSPESPFTCLRFALSKDFEGLVCSTMDGTVNMYSLAKTFGPLALEFKNSFNVFLDHRPLGEYYVAVSRSPKRTLKMAVACKSLNVVKLIRATHSSWVVFAELPGHLDSVLDISWAYNIGTEHDLIATGCADGHVRIFKLTKSSKQDDPDKKYQIVLTGDLDDHKSKVHQVEWNYMSTVLSTAGEDGRILQWKTSMLGEWSCFSIIRPHKEPSP